MSPYPFHLSATATVSSLLVSCSSKVLHYASICLELQTLKEYCYHVTQHCYVHADQCQQRQIACFQVQGGTFYSHATNSFHTHSDLHDETQGLKPTRDATLN